MSNLLAIALAFSPSTSPDALVNVTHIAPGMSDVSETPRTEVSRLEDTSGGYMAYGSSRDTFKIFVRASGTSLDPDSPYMGVYAQILEVDASIGYLCNSFFPWTPECAPKSYKFVEFILVSKNEDGWDTFTDAFGHLIEGRGCSVITSANAYFVPSGSADFEEVVDRLGDHDQAKPAQDGNAPPPDSIDNEPNFDGEPLNKDPNYLAFVFPDNTGHIIRVGGWSAGGLDVDGDGVDDSVASGEHTESLEDVLTNADGVEQPAAGSHIKQTFWNYCWGSGYAIGLGGVQ